MKKLEETNLHCVLYCMFFLPYSVLEEDKHSLL